MFAKRLFLVPLLVYVGWLTSAYDYHFLDGINLLFHEAGHVFFGFMGQTVHFLGGTFGQLFFPIACARNGRICLIRSLVGPKYRCPVFSKVEMSGSGTSRTL